MLNTIINFIMVAIKNGAPLLFGTTGEILTEKSGNMNLGVEGLMFMGGACGLAGSVYYNAVAGANANPIVGVLISLLSAFIAGCLGSLIFSFLTISLRANQNVTGLALTILGTGVGQFVGEYLRLKFAGAGGFVSLPNEFRTVFANSPFPQALQSIPVIGRLIFGHNVFIYIGLIIAVSMALFMSRTKKGLYLRAVGESPATADAAGINVEKYKYIATVLGGGISAVGGMVYTMTIANTVWSQVGISGQGWIAVALVIFALWRPANAMWGSALFGALMILYLWLPVSWLPMQIYKVIQYMVTILVLILVSIRQRKENQPPAALGLPYFREER